MKKAIIKRIMKLCERVPSPDSRSLNEIFHHPSFTQASKQERERIMLETSERAYLDESQYYSFERCFRLDLAPLLKGKIALDLGCFTGGRAVAWAERYQLDKIYGIDVRDIYIEAAKNFTERKCVAVKFVCAKGEKLPFEDGGFDAILSFDVFEHVQDVRQVLLECNRVLKRGGKLFVVFPSYFGPLDHHLTLVTLTPFVQCFFSGRDLIEAYNEIIDERGAEASWYKRGNRDLEPWERCNTINGTTSRRFRELISDGNWRVYYEYHPPLLVGMSKKHRALNLIKYAITPLAQLRGFEEFLSARIVYILEKP